MDASILSLLDATSVADALTLWTNINNVQSDLQADFAAIQSRLADAQKAQQFLQDLQSASSSASGPAKAQLQALIKLGQLFAGAAKDVRDLLGIDTTQFNARVAAINATVANITAQALQDYNAVLAFYDRLSQLEDSKGDLGIANQAFNDYATKWLNKVFTFHVGGSDLMVKFSTDLGSQRPFSDQANLAASVSLKGFTAKVDHIRLTVDATSSPPTAIPDFKSAHFTSDFDVQQVKTSLLSGLSFHLPGGVDLKNPAPHFDESPPNMTVDADVKGIPGFDTFEFTASFRATASEVTMFKGSGGVNDLVIPLPPGAFAIKGLAVGFASTPLSGFDHPFAVPALQVGTTLVPTEDGGTGATIKFDVADISQSDGLFFPLNDFGNEFSFRGTLILLETFPCGTVNGHFSLSPPELDVHFVMGSSSLPPTPFGSADIFQLDAKAKIDENGITFSGHATYFKFITGDIDGNISFSGSGHITASANAGPTVFHANATFSADWQPGFSTFSVDATASVEVSIKGFTAPIVSAHVNCSGNDGSKKGLVSAQILGQTITNAEISLDDDQNLGDFLSELLTDVDIGAIVGRLFIQGKALLNNLEQGIEDQFLRLSLTSLQPFTLIPDAVPAEAKQIYQKASKAVDDARKAAEQFVTNPGQAIGHAIDSLGSAASQVGQDLGIGGFLVGDTPATFPASTVDFIIPPTPDFIPIDFFSKVDDLLSQLAVADAATKIAAKLTADPSIQEAQQLFVLDSDARVDTRLDVRFDQIIVGANGVNSTQMSADSSYVAFYLTGGTSTRRRGRPLNATLAHWGRIRLTKATDGTRLATIIVNVDGAPLPDASLLNARFKIYNKLKAAVQAVDSTIRFGDASHPTADPNDPGPAASIDMAFDHPPAGKLPVLGDFGVSKVAVGPTGARIIQLIPGGAAAQAGLQQNDVIETIKGTHISSSKVITDTVHASLDRVLSVKVLVFATGATTTVNVALQRPNFAQSS
jgi:hypothetical protein